MYGCSCEESCTDDELCVCLAQHGCPYDQNGRLKNINQPEPIFECNDCCACENQACGNRVAQLPSQYNLVSFCTTGKGTGLKTLSKIPKGSFVIEYLGEMITSVEAAKRTLEQDPSKSSYLLTLQEHFGSKTIK